MPEMYIPVGAQAAPAQKPLLAMAAAGCVFLVTYILALSAMEQTSPVQFLFGAPTAVATTATPAAMQAPVSRRNIVARKAGQDDMGMAVRRSGQYTDIDGKGNVYAIEPKMSVESAEGKGSRTVLGAIVGLIAISIAIASLTKLNSFEETQGSYKGPTLAEISANLQRQIDA
jgi:hypothetical protein|eukprot:CAMPEP_0174284582 /NCGR_PEP_ID=MMETSP0809-20121228/6051_1 /TAXON_ID=73025 ORGANISM="Eutreptiella gymnastica-like, Strain CCMP1594" /NCGR_SAMPLE_ID=MMETSP0809 /ASSEMBLY_ACC=CAM_ASM_000658 /LENGTH=171 /DNA_ID=CAMNT_0015380127 /DNA_START=39 /DNA_END=554 /DNA_ORIENTATION=-